LNSRASAAVRVDPQRFTGEQAAKSPQIIGFC